MKDGALISETRYRRFSDYLMRRFGCRVHKVTVDAGFSCPNRDGLKSVKGCVFCDNKGFSFNSRKTAAPLEKQIARGIESAKKRFKAEKFMVYFQAYTNTYGSAETLRTLYNKVRGFKDIVGISIGTRPDCIDKKALDVIDELSSDYEIWLEYGLQSIHDKTLELINRGHYYDDFLKAVSLTRERKKIKIAAHAIIGLPGETMRHMIETAKEMGRLELDGIKIHPLYIIRGTELEALFNAGKYKPLGMDEYIGMACEFLQYLWPDTVIQRITADCPREYLSGPSWIPEKRAIIKRINEKLEKEGTRQGKLWQSTNI